MTTNKKPSNPYAFGHGNPTHGGEPGMTLRDYFAAKAMQSLVLARESRPGPHQETSDILAADAYVIADFMLKERSKS